MSSSTFLSLFRRNAEKIANFKIHFKCWAFSLALSKDANSCCNAQTGDAVRRMRASVAVPQWRVVVPMAPPPTPGLCKGSRCAAAVKQESHPHPPLRAHLPSLHPDIYQPVRTNPPKPQTASGLPKKFTRCLKCGGGGRAMLTWIVWLIRVKQKCCLFNVPRRRINTIATFEFVTTCVFHPIFQIRNRKGVCLKKKLKKMKEKWWPSRMESGRKPVALAGASCQDDVFGEY